MEDKLAKMLLLGKSCKTCLYECIDNLCFEWTNSGGQLGNEKYVAQPKEGVCIHWEDLYDEEGNGEMSKV